MNTKFFRWTVSLAAILGMSVTLTGCGDGEKDSAKLLSGEKKLSAEEERIQKLLKIRVWNYLDSTWEDVTGRDLAKAMPMVYRGQPVGPSQFDTCAQHNSAAILLSYAINFNKWARSLVPSDVIDQASGRVYYRIPAQEHSSRVYMYDISRHTAYRAMASALRQLEGSVVLTSVCNPEGQTAGAQLAEIFSLAYHTYIDSTNGAIESSVLAGEQIRSQAAMERDGRIQAYSYYWFSRNAAAHYIAMSVRGWGGDAHYDPFCANGPLTPTVKRALDLIRIAAPDPWDLADLNVSTGALLGGAPEQSDPGASPQMGTVGERLAAFLSDSSFESDVLTRANLSLADFAEARNYLRLEQRAFLRTTLPLPSVSGAAFERYASTATPPKSLPDVVYSAMTRFKVWGVVPNTISDDNANSNEWADLDLSDFGWNVPGRDLINSMVSRAVQTLMPTLKSRIEEYSANDQSKLNETLKAPLLDLMGKINGQAWGSIGMRKGNQALDFDIELKSPTELRFIVGVDGLRCFLDGNIEGATCDLNDYEVQPTMTFPAQGETSSDPSSMFGYRQSYSLPTPDANYPDDLIFIVDQPSSELSKVVFGARWGNLGTGMPGGETLVFEESNQQIGKLLSLNGEWCGETKFDCLGNHVGEKLPLENELSKDELDMESSWKRYLELAKQSAAEAELRGKEYIEAGLAVERRKEEIWRDRDSRSRQSVEKLQEICGSSMDPRILQNFLKGNGIPAPQSPTCTVSSQCNEVGARAYYQCLAGQCVADFTKLSEQLGSGEPELVRLANCIASDIVPFATPGDQALCLWVEPDNENVVCQGSGAGKECPTLPKGPTDGAANEACAGLTKPSGAVWRLVPRRAALSYFSVASSSGNTSPTDVQPVCESIRAIRATLGSSTLHGGGASVSGLSEAEIAAHRKRIINSRLFHPDIFTSRASTWSFEAVPESNIRVLWNGRELLTTGGVGLEGKSATQSWPCGPQGRPADCTSADHFAAGVTCDFVDCSVAWKRGDLVSRLLNASGILGMARRPGASGSVGGIGLPLTSVVVNDGLKVCDDANETLVYRNSATPLRIRKCADAQWMTTNGSATSDRIIWRGSRSFYIGDESDDVHETQGVKWVADWFVDGSTSPKSGELVLKAGEWVPMPIWSGSAANDFDLGILNGMSDASDAPGSSDSSSPYRRLVRNALDGRSLEGVEDVVSNESEARNTFGIDYARAALDAMELYCHAQAQVGLECDPSTPPPPIATAADFPRAAKYLKCVGDTINSRTGKMVLAKVPQQAMDALRKASAVGAFPAVGGEYGRAVSQLRSALVEISDVAPAIASEIRQMGTDIESIGAALQIGKIKAELADQQFMSSMSNALTSCASSGGFGAIANCANALAQTQFLTQINRLQQAEIDQTEIRDLAQFRSQLEARSRALGAYGNRANAAMEQIDAQLAGLEGLRLTAQRHAAEALYVSSYGAPNSEAIDNIQSWKYQEARRRYESSAKVARTLAIVARRSIEQRLGVRLETLKDELPLVEAPNRWVQSVCQAEGVGFDDIAKLGTTTGGPDPAEANRFFLGNFLTDYVSKLERTVESYRMAFPFQEGVDEAIVSVRNDLMHSRIGCEVASPNLVPNSERLDQISGSSSTPGSGWTQFDCSSQDASTDFAGCISIEPYPTRIATTTGESVQLYTLLFDMSRCAGVSCTSTSSPKLGMALELSGGLYNLSYITKESADDSCRMLPRVVNAEGEVVPFEGQGWSKDLASGTSTVARHFKLIRISSGGRYSLQFGESTSGGCVGASVVFPAAFLGNVMLTKETLGGWKAAEANHDLAPGYVPSAANGMSWASLCPDTHGTGFRESGWSERKCLRLCTDGYSDSCDERSGQLECYHEMRFSLDETRIENSELFQGAGFAKGNFNYRVEQIGVNLVGTGVRYCDLSKNPQSCYGNGNLQYSIEHLGPFYVRNHLGNDVESKIFPGHIEHARGLATERYLTNPLSTTDRALLEPYVRGEFQGRPLGGEYVLRVWESPEVRFEKIEDVQFYLRYRYWTRQN